MASANQLPPSYEEIITENNAALPSYEEIITETKVLPSSCEEIKEDDHFYSEKELLNSDNLIKINYEKIIDFSNIIKGNYKICRICDAPFDSYIIIIQ